MSRIFSYYGPLDIGSAFASKSDVGDFVEYMVKHLNKMVLENKEDDLIPPVIYSDKGKVFNFDYNFLINCLDDYYDNVGIKNDFYLTENPSQHVLKNGLFLIEGILDNYYNIVRIRQRTLDVSRIKSNRTIDIKERFYNIVVIGNGNNIKRFSAIPFSGSEIKKIISDNMYNLLVSISDRECFEQVAFGLSQFASWMKNADIIPTHVTN